MPGSLFVMARISYLILISFISWRYLKFHLFDIFDLYYKHAIEYMSKENFKDFLLFFKFNIIFHCLAVLQNNCYSQTSIDGLLHFLIVKK
jgi:hypothetical protein